MSKLLLASVFAIVLLGSAMLVPGAAFAHKNSDGTWTKVTTENSHKKKPKDPDKDKDNDHASCVHSVKLKNGKYKKNCDSDQDYKPLKRPIVKHS